VTTFIGIFNHLLAAMPDAEKCRGMSEIRIDERSPEF
jgi:hypothetical protein